jgi:hypothetical protein
VADDGGRVLQQFGGDSRDEVGADGVETGIRVIGEFDDSRLTLRRIIARA